MADEKQNSQNFEDDLLADFHIAQAKKSARLAASQVSTQTSDRGSTEEKAGSDTTQPPRKTRPVQRPAAAMPRKPDGTPYSIAELRQSQASRQTGRDRMTPYGELPQTRPLPPRQDPRRQSERIRQQSAYDAAYRQQNPGQKKPVYRHRRIHKPNGALLLFAVLVLMVGGISISQIAKNRSSAADDPLPPDIGVSDVISPEDTETDAAEPDPEELVLWNTTQIDNSLLDDGSLILVNYQYPYADADTIPVKDVYGNKKVVVLSPIWRAKADGAVMGEDFEKKRNMVEAEAAARGFYVINGLKLVPPLEDLYADKYLHPNGLGFGVYAENLIKELVKIF